MPDGADAIFAVLYVRLTNLLWKTSVSLLLHPLPRLAVDRPLNIPITSLDTKCLTSPAPCPLRRHVDRAPLSIPIISFDGRRDLTIARGHMLEWRRYTTGRFRNVPVDSDHYFVSTHYRQARGFVVFVVFCSFEPFMTDLVASWCGLQAQGCRTACNPGPEPAGASSTSVAPTAAPRRQSTLLCHYLPTPSHCSFPRLLCPCRSRMWWARSAWLRLTASEVVSLARDTPGWANQPPPLPPRQHSQRQQQQQLERRQPCCPGPLGPPRQQPPPLRRDQLLCLRPPRHAPACQLRPRPCQHASWSSWCWGW